MTHHRDEGFSLLEVVVATTILTIALVAVAQLFPAAAWANARARNATVATLLAVDKVEQLRSGEFAPTIGEQQDSPLDGRYLRRWVVQPLPSRPDDALAVRVIVADRIGQPLVRIVTVRARPSS